MMKCPHCDGKAIIRSSEYMSPLVRKLYYQCKNVNCSFSFIAMETVMGTVVPSGCPNPKIHIPLSTRGQFLQKQKIA
ncbi:TPA: ogr/Delta-like zinc finger family protein [Escherichia coli]|mgnify:FL=1|uniref:Ogr/Delta-like zinc finger family protein n=1 Tax=Escherichia coli TaxID=562 RepID=A0A271UA19_ECOLX|nr:MULTISPECIES: ogr/Delta-like zinc finger family protein [Escherichia]EFA8284823.1 ogr/Delta-like zinc finger family protein [Escherichia coli O157]EAB7916710.1 transcriptional regulator [Escherichia coli]EER0851837.1 ogr/Delta-like zinc finger family protein [Escherichia coli]EES7735048.1 ogr/Delta-like zinc finger family protein [Escherichia coli]EEV6840070.1 transcriptional regulator [Escherichia coli]